jgi:phosphatidylglycerol:prolipoprotein diacylglycerol transferase
VGITLTRLVNFINDELWGDVCSPDHPWCMVPGNTTDWGMAPRHPSQLYEAILDAITLPILLVVYKRRPPDGVVGWTWFTLYGITRSVAEAWRFADFHLGPITGGQLYALPMIPIGIIGIYLCWRRGVRTEERVHANDSGSLRTAAR